MKTFLLFLLFPCLCLAQKITVTDSGNNSQIVTMSGDASVTSAGVVTTTIHKFSVSVNAKNTGATTIGTTASSLGQFHPLFLVFDCTAASAITVTFSASIGTNSTSFDNILGITSATGVTSAKKYLKFDLGTSVLTSVDPSTAISVKVTTAATGTSETVTVALFGYYQ